MKPFIGIISNKAYLKGHTLFFKGLKVYSALFLTLFTAYLPSRINAQQIYLAPGSYMVSNGSPSIVAKNIAINNNGTFVAGNGTVVFAGYSDTTKSYVTGTSTTTLNNVAVDKHSYGVAFKSSVWVTNVDSMISGNMYTDNNLTLISDSANTARVAYVPSGCNINGKAYVQRYIPPRRAWRLLTAPITSSNTIYNAWQNGGVYTPNVGTLITMPNPTPGSGMDSGINTNYSMKTFNKSTQALVSVTNTIATNISPGSSGAADNIGYFIFVRGDRNPLTVNLPALAAPAVSTTLSSFGNLQTQTQSFTAAPDTGEFTLIGNPYASPIDFNNVTRSNVIKRFYVWDPTLNQVGGYVVLDDILNTGTYTKSVSASSQTNQLQSGQAFFVETLNTAPASLTINESSKSPTNNTLIFRPTNIVIPTFYTNLYLLNDDSTTSFADGSLAQFNSAFNAGVDWQDALKLSNVNEGIGLLRNKTNLAMERRPAITANDTLFLKLTGTTARNYQFEFIADNMQQPLLNGTLIDNYLGTTTPINMSGTTNVNFTVVSGVAASAGASRFMIVFKPATVTPVTFTNVEAYQKNNGIQVDWKVENEFNVAQYEVEKSSDGKNFTEVNITIATGNNHSSVDYSWLDGQPFVGNNYYRIKSVDENGTINYSQVVMVSTGNPDNSITVYPNPVINHIMNVTFNNQPKGNYIVNLINEDGQLVYSKEISINSSNSVHALTLSGSLAQGTYEVRIEGGDNKQTTQKIIIQ